MRHDSEVEVHRIRAAVLRRKGGPLENELLMGLLAVDNRNGS